MADGLYTGDVSPAAVLDEILGNFNGDVGRMRLTDLVAMISGQASIQLAGVPSYQSTAAGLAATAEGGYFSVVPGTGAPDVALILYRELSGVAVEQARVASSVFVTTLKSRLDTLVAAVGTDSDTLLELLNKVIAQAARIDALLAGAPADGDTFSEVAAKLQAAIVALQGGASATGDTLKELEDRIAAATNPFGVAGGSANALTVTTVPALPAGLAANTVIWVQAVAVNTGPVTLNAGGTGAKSILAQDGSNALEAGDLQPNTVYQLRYNGTSWVMLTGDLGPGSTKVLWRRQAIYGVLTDSGTSGVYFCTPSVPLPGYTTDLVIWITPAFTIGGPIQIAITSPTTVVKDLYRNDTTPMSGDDWLFGGRSYPIRYNGTRWVLLEPHLIGPFSLPLTPRDVPSDDTVTVLDYDRLIRATGVGPVLVTLPNNLPKGFRCRFVHLNLGGMIAFADGPGATLDRRPEQCLSTGRAPGRIVTAEVYSNTNNASAKWRLVNAPASPTITPDIVQQRFVMATAFIPSTTPTPSATYVATAYAPEIATVVTVGGGAAMYSLDGGVTYQAANVPSGFIAYSVVWAPEIQRFVAVGPGASQQRAYISTGGNTWVACSTPFQDLSWNSVCWSPELNMLVACSNTQQNNSFMTSVDGGANWIVRTSLNLAWTSVCWSSELALFVAVAATGSGNRVATSRNGVNWTLGVTPADNGWLSVVWASGMGRFVAVAATGSGNRVMTSADGFAWLIGASAADSFWKHISYSPELNLLLALSDSGPANARQMMSTDAFTWVLAGTVGYAYNASVWCRDYRQFAVCLYLGSGNQALTSVSGFKYGYRS